MLAEGRSPAPEGPTSAIISPGTTEPEVAWSMCLVTIVCLSTTCNAHATEGGVRQAVRRVPRPMFGEGDFLLSPNYLVTGGTLLHAAWQQV